MLNFDIFSFNLLDILDILIVTGLIYYLLMFVRGTRAVAAINGLVVLFVIYVVAQFLRLDTLVWIFENLFSSLFLVIVILFHEDIRQALSSLSLSSLFSKKKSYEEEFTSILAETCFYLAEKKIGALIVLEIDMPLGDMTEQGVKLDALVSKDLLTTIFIPKTPLHDGAIIINKDTRIVAASCIMPLAESDNQAFGTRHRAALGITSVSDALAIVVSEERGEVTIARHSEISQPLNPANFERVLQDALY